MVYSTGGGLRTFVKVAVVCALTISSIQVQASHIDSATGSAGDELLEDCGISDGDKAFGIQVVTDVTCALGGLGCYNDHCRYCKLVDTLKSAHFENCESLGASFPTMAPLTISSGPCEVSSGDAAVGVGAMTDPSCLYGGIGCFSDHCRFCQSEPTLQSSHFLSCSWTKGSSSTSGSDDRPVGYTGLVPIRTTEGANMSASTSGHKKEAVEAGSVSSCTMTVSDGDAAVGISITTDTTCASGGNGCIDSICRFCKVKDTTQSAHFNACPTVVNSKVCTTTVSAGDAAAGINIITDSTCAQGGLGCIDSVCRFCRATTTASSSYLDCASVGGSASTTQAPSVTTPVPITTTAPVTTAPVPTPTATSTVAKLTCSQTVSDGDAAVGIKIVTDTSCSTGGVGCIDQVCRFCRVTTTAQSASFVECTTIQGTTTTTATPPPTSSPPTIAPPTKTPAPTTAAPAKTPAPTTTAPVTTAPSAAVCTITAATGDISAGINVVTDITCTSGGLGCIDTVCRFCKTKTTTQSSSYPDCATIAGTATQAPAVTATPTPKPPATTTSTPSIVFDCFRTVSSGDKGVGLDIVSDIRCSEGGTGCLDEVCRFCKRFDTVQSQTYLDCTSIPSADIGSDITFVPIPVVDDSDSATRMLALNAYESDAASGCTMTVSAGDAAVGINIVTDTSCSSGGTGCIDSVCRYCKTKDTVQSAHFNSCPVTTMSGTVSTKVCAMTVSSGDAAVGIDIITDVSCANGGLGCIDSICRYCKTKSTDQSAHFGSCSGYLSTATTSPATAAPVATAAPTNTPISTTSTYSIPLDCYQTASNGDKNLGLDIVTDIRCGDGGVGCVDSVCRFCKRFDTPQSRTYMNCSDIPSSDNGADINFKAIGVIDDTKETLAETIVAIRESTELAAESDEPCANVVLADGEVAGGIGVVLDTERCPSGLASGCIGDSGCRYCMRFPTNVSNYLEYCTIVNSTDVAYALSGVSPSVGDDSTISTNAGTGSLSDEGSSPITVETRASHTPITKLFESATMQWVAVAAVCIGAIAIVGLAVFGIKRTIGSLTRSSARSSDKEKVSPDDENRPSVLITSNVGEPGVISDVEVHVLTQLYCSQLDKEPSYVMGGMFSREPVTVSPLTHHFQSTTQAGTLVYVALSKKKHRVNPITESRRLDNSIFFGLKVPLEEIEIESQIGTGTFGVVYKAFYKGKHVALKRLLAQRYSAKTVQDFKNELSILSILQHSNIVMFLGAVLEPPTLCLLTELCAGSLADLLQLARNQQLNITWGLTLEIALDCAKACAYLHALNPAVLHRDIKGENLLITEDFRCKLSDFGLSRSLDKNANAQTMCGTPRWLAPEVFRGEDYSEKIDVYSYGIVLWELFCFKKPYLDKDAINLAYLVAHEDLRPELLPHIPEILHRIMKACWDPEPIQRPSFSTVIFLIEEAKNVVPLGLAIDLSKSFSEATAVQRHLSTRPKTPSAKKNYGLTSGMI